MAVKVTVDLAAKLIICKAGVTDIDVKVDIYSDLKEDWVANAGGELAFDFPLRVVGGDPVSGTKNLGATFFLVNGWRIRPQEANHRLLLTGNLYTDPAGDSPVVGTVGAYSVIVEYSVSNLVDSTLTQLPEIQYSSFQGGVTINALSGTPGTVFPLGTAEYPVDNLADAKTIASSRGFRRLFVIGNLTIEATDDISGLWIVGEGATVNVAHSTITLVSGCATANTTYVGARITGRQGGESTYEDCVIGALTNAHCAYRRCVLVGPVTVTDGVWSDGHVSELVDCCTALDWYVLDYNASPMDQIWSSFSGNIKIINCTNPLARVTLQAGAASIWLDASCTAGVFVFRGTAEFRNDTTPAAGLTVNIDGLVTMAPIQYSSFQDGVTLSVLIGAPGTNFPKGTPAYPVNNLTDAKAIAAVRGFTKLYLLGDLTIGATDDVSALQIIGEGANLNVARSTVLLVAGCNTLNTTFIGAVVSGAQGGESAYEDCVISTLTNAHGTYKRCALVTSIVRAGTADTEVAEFVSCYTGLDWFVLDYNNSQLKQLWSDFSGNLKVINYTNAGARLMLHATAGHIWLDASCTAGEITLRGNAKLLNESPMTPDTTGLIQPIILDTVKATVTSVLGLVL